MIPNRCPTEGAEQTALASYLDYIGVLWCHVPQGVPLSVGGDQRRLLQPMLTAKRLKRHGLKPGVPDVLIFTPPPMIAGALGCAIELKRIKGSVTSDAQRYWKDALEKLGWAASIQKGADASIAWLTTLGYGRR